jgi:hypothetical protein
MDIKEVITVINQMQADGVVERYAVGGAVGATFYLEPVATLDVDIFVTFESAPGSLIVSPRRIYDYLAGWPVQFLPPTGPLVAEALKESAIKDVDGTPARVLTAEHLAAIALQTGRAKDKARLLQFVEAGVLDDARFQAILARHGLVAAWQKFERQFLSDAP